MWAIDVVGLIVRILSLGASVHYSHPKLTLVVRGGRSCRFVNILFLFTRIFMAV